MGLQLPKWLIKLSGDLYVHKFPFYMVYKPGHHKVSGTEVRSVLNGLKVGDILLRRYNGFVNTFFTPGFWGHAALYVGRNSVIHAVGEGVIKEDILTFCRTDSVCVLRPRKATDALIKAAVKRAHHAINEEYDYAFKDGNGKVYCTELVNECYGDIFRKDFEDVAGNQVLTPDGIRKSNKVSAVVEYKH